MKAFDSLNQKLLNLLLVAGGVSLLTMLGLTCYNIAMRPFHLSISGVYELMGYCGAIVITCGLAYAQSKKAHLRVDLVVNSYPRPIRSLIHFINHLICILIAGIAVWKIGVKGWTFYSTGEVSETLLLHYYPFTFGVAAGFSVLALLLVADLIGDLSGDGEDKG
jgi:TRAP-type C4-dicarboxylate transport system permease small subunit